MEGGSARPWDLRHGQTAEVIPDSTTPGSRLYRCNRIANTPEPSSCCGTSTPIWTATAPARPLSHCGTDQRRSGERQLSAGNSASDRLRGCWVGLATLPTLTAQPSPYHAKIVNCCAITVALRQLFKQHPERTSFLIGPWALS